MIVVTAAGGQTGTAVAGLLRAQGRAVRAVVSSPRARAELAALGAEVAVADLADAERFEQLLDGAQALYLIWPNFVAGEAEGAAGLFAAARRAAVPRVVYHSVLRPQARAMPHHAAKDAAEEALDASRLRWRVLQPCAYVANLDAQLPAVAATGRFRSPWGLAQAQSMIDLHDVAEAAVALLTEDGLDGGTFEVAGPEPLTAPRIAAELAGWAGREVTAIDVVPDGPVPPADDYAAHCLRLMFDHYRAHGFTGSPRVLEALLGRPARTLADHLASVPVPGPLPVPDQVGPLP